MKKLLSFWFILPLVLIGNLVFASVNKSKPFSVHSVFKDLPGKITLEQLKVSLSVPWGFDFIDGATLIVSERKGSLSVVDLKAAKKIAVKGVPKVVARGQGGLLDVRVSPSFKTDNLVYLSYSMEEGSKYSTQISRAVLKFKNGSYRLDNLKVLFTAQPFFSTAHHFGSRITFAPQGLMYFSVGDRGHRKLAQDLDTDNGKIHRLYRDGRVPKDNPFSRKGRKSSVWSYGHRNPQGLYYEEATGVLWEQEHGPQGGDEINIIDKAGNYGWPVVTYGEEYGGGKIGEGNSKKGMIAPKKYFVPSIAPSGLIVYSGRVFKQWKSWLFSGALALQHLNLVVRKGKSLYSENRLFEQLNQRVRNVREGPDGFIYFSTDRLGLFRMRPALANDE